MRTWRILASAGALLALLMAAPAAAQLQKMPGDAQPDQFRTPATTDMTWRDMGCALGGTFTPHLAGTGTLEGGELITLTMSNVICDSPAYLVVGFDSIYADLFGGILVPAPRLVILAQTPAPAHHRFRDGTAQSVEVGDPVSGRLTPVLPTGGSVICKWGGDHAPMPIRIDSGVLELQGIFPSRIPSGTHFYFQFWVVDAEGPRGWCASNAVMGLTP